MKIPWYRQHETDIYTLISLPRAFMHDISSLIILAKDDSIDIKYEMEQIHYICVETSNECENHLLVYAMIKENVDKNKVLYDVNMYLKKLSAEISIKLETSKQSITKKILESWNNGSSETEYKEEHVHNMTIGISILNDNIEESLKELLNTLLKFSKFLKVT